MQRPNEECVHAFESGVIDHPDFVIRREYVDYNGHLNVGYYAVLFDRALEALRSMLGIGTGELAGEGSEWFARDSHIAYQRELAENSHLSFRFFLVAYDATHLHVALSMHHKVEGWTAASCELVAWCVKPGTTERHSWPAGVIENLKNLRSRHQLLDRPAAVGGAILVRHPHLPGTFSDLEVNTDSRLPGNIKKYMDGMEFPGCVVAPEYIDESGNIRPGFLPVLITSGLRRFFFEAIGIGAPFMQLTGQTDFVARSHLVQMRKLLGGDPVTFDFKLTALGEKVFQCMCTVRHAKEGWVAAVQEQLDVCVDVRTRRPAIYHPHSRARLEIALAQFEQVPDPIARGQAASLEN